MTTTLNVQGMTCHHCVMSVAGALKALQGIKDVKVELQSGKVTIDHDGSEARIPEFKHAIEAQGYDVA